MTVDVEVLAREHKRAYHTDEGIEFHSVPSLLSQLRDAVYGAAVSDGAGGPAKSKLPIQAAALDLYMLIDRQITEAWATAFKRVPGVETPERLLSEWAAWADPETILTVDDRTVYAPIAVAGWVARIEDYLNPPRLAPIDLPCPSCGERYQYRAVDGEERRSAVLFFRRDRNTGDTLDARCESCGVVWAPSQFMFFLTALNAAGREG
jgi:hypothetical protein